MTWIDWVGVLVLLAVARFQSRREAGLSLLNAVATIGAVQLSNHLAAPVTSALGWKPLPGTEISPLAHALCFAATWAAALCVAQWAHRNTLWSMDSLDPLIGAALGLLVAVTAGHEVVDIAARMAIMKHGELPDYFQTSWVAEELRSFSTYRHVVSVFHSLQYGGH